MKKVICIKTLIFGNEEDGKVTIKKGEKFELHEGFLGLFLVSMDRKKIFAVSKDMLEKYFEELKEVKDTSDVLKDKLEEMLKKDNSGRVELSIENGNEPCVSNVKEEVNHPDHYNEGCIECIDYIEDVLGLEGFDAFCIGNAIKYLHRAGKKDSKYTDIEKAIWYLKRIVE